MKNPIRDKEIRLAKGLVYEAVCKKCNLRGFGMHIVQKNEQFNRKDVKDCCCINCGSLKVGWELVGQSAGDIIVPKKDEK